MANVDGEGETGSQHYCRHHRACPVDDQGVAQWVVISSGGGALDVLHGPQHIEQAHGNDHPNPVEQLRPACQRGPN